MSSNVHPIRQEESIETEWSVDQDNAVRVLASALHRLNEAVTRCVDSGLTVELMRAARYHDTKGHWGDQMIPIIRRND